MTAITANPSPATSSSQRWLRRIGWVLLWAMLAIYYVAPPREAMDHTLDSSNYGTYALFVAEGRQYGTEVIPMAGPLGFVLYGHTYAGVMFEARWALELLLKGAFAALLLHLAAASTRRGLAALWVLAAVVLIPTVDDLLHDYAILLAGLIMLRAYHGGSFRWALFATILLGPISLMKGTHFMTTGMIAGFAVAYGLTRRRPGEAAQLAGCFIGSLLTAWLATGQNPANLGAYVRNVLELSSGYNATMGLDEPRVFLITGLSLAAGLLAWMAVGWWQARRSSGVTAALLLIGAFTFIKWKHGFLRADGHVYIFFTAVGVLAPTVLLITRGGLYAPVTSIGPRLRRLGLALFSFTFSWGYISSCAFWGHRMWEALTDVPLLLPRNVEYVFRPATVRARFERKLDANRLDRDLPQIRNEVGDDPIDFFGNEQGVLLLNDLIYEPRPVGGGTFSTFTLPLQRLNEAYVRDRAHHPRWQLLKIGLLDHRLPAVDDGLALRALLEEYTPVMMQRDYLLLKSRDHPAPPSAPDLITRVPVRFGESIPVPIPSPTETILFSFEGKLDVTGRLQTLFYRPPDIELTIAFGGQAQFRRYYDFKPGMVREPIILSPLVDATDAIINLFEPGRGIIADAITFTAEPGYDEKSLFVSFYRVPRPPVPEDADITEIRTYHQHPLFNREPVNYVSEETGIRELNKESIRIVHAPGSITWDLQPGDQQLIFSYGLMPQAYSNGGSTDGVGFNVEVIWPSNDGRILWNRLLEPLYRTADQGMQRARIMLPPYEPGAQLRIRTDAGPAGNGAYDQSYITRVQIKPGSLIAEQFNGLGAIPLNRELPRDAIAHNGEHPVFLVHAPGEVRISRPGNTQAVSFEYGLLPSAYSNGGQTDGVAFELWAEGPGGYRERLDAWYVNPRANPGEQGAQNRTVPLPTNPAAQTLLFVTSPGPNNDRGWDQSYLASVTFTPPSE